MNLNANSGEPGVSMPLIQYDVVRELAVNVGFTECGLVGLPHASESRDAQRYSTWIDEGRAGTMQYLKRTGENGELVRARVANPFPWARSAIVCLTNYSSDAPRSTDPAPETAGWIARYAWSSRTDAQRGRVPSDYHKVVLKRLKLLETKLHEKYGNFETRAYVDTGPVVERSLAVAAGLGWSAKNTCLIHPKLGSYVFLSVLITSLDVAADERPLRIPDRCGTCTRCIEACPTDALFAPYRMDATRCISYLTIEHKGPIAPELMKGMGRQVFGCDICQDVCPWNSPRRIPIAADPELVPREELVNPLLEWLASMDEEAFERTFNGSPVRRAQYNGMRRNVAIAMGNAQTNRGGSEEHIERLRVWAESQDGALRTAAEWALRQLNDLGKTAEEH